MRGRRTPRHAQALLGLPCANPALYLLQAKLRSAAAGPASVSRRGQASVSRRGPGLGQPPRARPRSAAAGQASVSRRGPPNQASVSRRGPPNQPSRSCRGPPSRTQRSRPGLPNRRFHDPGRKKRPECPPKRCPRSRPCPAAPVARPAPRPGLAFFHDPVAFGVWQAPNATSKRAGRMSSAVELSARNSRHIRAG